MRIDLIWFFYAYQFLNENHSHLARIVPRGTFFLFSFFSFLQMIIILNWLFSIFWRACASANVKYFSECYLKTCDQLGAGGHSLFLARGRQCECEVVAQRCCLRRLYSTWANLSSLFCDFQQLNADWSSLAQRRRL